MYAMRLFPSSPGSTTVKISCCLVTGDPRPKGVKILINTGMQCPQHTASGRPTFEAWVAALSPSESPGNRWSPRLKHTAQIHNRKRGDLAASSAEEAIDQESEFFDWLFTLLSVRTSSAVKCMCVGTWSPPSCHLIHVDPHFNGYQLRPNRKSQKHSPHI